MTEAPALPLPERWWRRPPAPRRARPNPPTPWNTESASPVEIVAPDRYCTDLLLEHLAPTFPAEIVPGPPWIVRLQPPAGGGWVYELISLVERWLESAPLPCAKVHYGGRSYLIRASTDVAQRAVAGAPAVAPTR